MKCFSYLCNIVVLMDGVYQWNEVKQLITDILP